MFPFLAGLQINSLSNKNFTCGLVKSASECTFRHLGEPTSPACLTRQCHRLLVFYVVHREAEIDTAEKQEKCAVADIWKESCKKKVIGLSNKRDVRTTVYIKGYFCTLCRLLHHTSHQIC